MKSPLIVQLMSALVLVSALAGCLDLDTLAPQTAENTQGAGSATSDPDGQEEEPAEPESQPAQNGSGAEEEPQQAPDEETTAEQEEPEPADPPVARLFVENESVSELAGQAPFTVSFELEAEYEDLAGLQWTFSPGDENDNVTGDGNELPYLMNHTYQDAGTFTANLTVAAQEHSNTSSVLIDVEEAVQEILDPVVIEGEARVGNPAHSQYCVRNVANSGAGVDEEIDGNLTALDPAGAGWVYALEPADNFTMYWYDDANRLWIADDVNPDEESPRLGEAGSEGIVPEDATHVEVCMHGPTDSTPEGLPYTLILWPPGHPDAPAA